jgi:hypothetical protein
MKVYYERFDFDGVGSSMGFLSMRLIRVVLATLDWKWNEA